METCLRMFWITIFLSANSSELLTLGACTKQLWKSASSWFSVLPSLCYFVCREQCKYDQTDFREKLWFVIFTIVCRYIPILVNMRVYVNLSYLEVSGLYIWDSLCSFWGGSWCRKTSEGLELIIKHDHTYVSLFKISQNLRDPVLDFESAGEVRRNFIGHSAYSVKLTLTLGSFLVFFLKLFIHIKSSENNNMNTH